MSEENSHQNEKNIELMKKTHELSGLMKVKTSRKTLSLTKSDFDQINWGNIPRNKTLERFKRSEHIRTLSQSVNLPTLNQSIKSGFRSPTKSILDANKSNDSIIANLMARARQKTHNRTNIVDRTSSMTVHQLKYLLPHLKFEDETETDKQLNEMIKLAPGCFTQNINTRDTTAQFLGCLEEKLNKIDE